MHLCQRAGAEHQSQAVAHGQNTGYKGRTGIVEVLVLTPTVKQLIMKNAQEHEIRDQARQEGMPSLRDNGMKKVLEGVTSIEEVLRVTMGDQDVELK